MFGNWVVGAVIRFSTNGVQTMQRLSSSANMANASLQKQQGVINANQLAMMRYKERIAEVRAAQLRLAATMAAAGAAMGFAVMGDAVSHAANLQTAMVGIQNATGATNAQMEKLRDTAYSVSAATAQSVTDSARVMGVMARSGINDPNQLAKIALPAAKFADVQFLSRGVSFEEGAKQAIQAAHLFQQYGGPGMTKMFDQLTRLSFMMPDSLSQYITQAGYYMPVFRRLGVKDDQAFVAGAFLDRMGLGRGKGGTGLQNFIMEQMGALALTGHVQVARKTALGNLGLLNADGSAKYYSVDRKKYGDDKAHFDVFGALNAINDSVIQHTKGLSGRALAEANQKAVIDIQKALGITGGRIGFMGTPEALGQLNSMLKQMPTLPGSDKAQARYMNTLAGQFQLAMTNFQSVMTELGWPWLQSLTDFFRNLGNSLHTMQQWLHTHKDAEKTIGLVIASLTALFSVFSIVASASMIARFAGLSEAFSWIGGAISWLATRIFAGGVLDAIITVGARFVPFIGWAMLFVSAVKLLHDHAAMLPKIVDIVFKWWNDNRGRIGYTIGYVFGEIGVMLSAAITSLLAAGQFAIQQMVQNAWMVGLPGGPQMLANLGAAAMAQYAQQHPLKGPGFLGGIARGAGDASRGQAFDWNNPYQKTAGVSIKEVHLHMAPGSNGHQVAHQFFDALSDPVGLARKAGSGQTSPKLPAPMSIGGAVFGR